MSTFYRPFSTTIANVPTIIYPMLGVETIIDRAVRDSLENSVLALYTQNTFVQAGTLNIVILWVNGEELMTDVWIFSNLESADTGFTIDCKTFRGLTQIVEDGITASDGLIMLGRECELEEAVRFSGQDLVQNYVFGPRPQLPGDLNPTEEFYT